MDLPVQKSLIEGGNYLDEALLVPSTSQISSNQKIQQSLRWTFEIDCV
jgi:hypothetical protein